MSNLQQADLNTDLIIDSQLIITVLDYSIKRNIDPDVYTLLLPAWISLINLKTQNCSIYSLSTFDNIRGLKQNFSFCYDLNISNIIIILFYPSTKFKSCFTTDNCAEKNSHFSSWSQNKHFKFKSLVGERNICLERTLLKKHLQSHLAGHGCNFSYILTDHFTIKLSTWDFTKHRIYYVFICGTSVTIVTPKVVFVN